MKLKHSIYSGRDVCVFVKDPQKDWKYFFTQLKIPEIKKVIGVSKLRKKYKSYEDKRLLCNSFDLFLCDKSIAPSLPSLLGSYFIEKKKLPISITFSKTNLSKTINDSICSTYYKLTNGSCVTVKVAMSSMSSNDIIDNVNIVLDNVIKFHIEDKKFKNHIDNIFLNWGGNESLPLYSYDLFSINDIKDTNENRYMLLHQYNISGILVQVNKLNTFNYTNSYSTLYKFNKNIVTDIYKAARSGQTNIELWRKYTTDLIDILDELNIKELCSILYSYGYMKYRHRILLELISSKMNQYIKILSSDQISIILKTFSILQFKNHFLFQLMLPEISLRLQTMKPSDISSIFYSYTNLGYYNKNLYYLIECSLYKCVNKLTPFDMTLIFSSYSKLINHLDYKILTVLSCQFLKLLDIYDDKLFSLSVNALSKLNFCNHKHALSLIESEVYKRTDSKSNINSLSLVLLISALSKHTLSSNIISHLSNIISKRIKDLDIHSLCLLSSSLSRILVKKSELLNKIAEHVGIQSLELYPRAIASILYSYGKIGHLHGSLFYFCTKHLELYTNQYTCDEVGMILRSLTVLNIKNESLLSTIADYINSIMPDYVPNKFIDSHSHVRFSNLNRKDEVNKDDSEQYNKEIIENQSLLLTIPILHGNSEGNSTFLGDAKIHTLLWIVECYANFLYYNTSIDKMLSKLSNEILNKSDDITSMIVSKLIHAYVELDYKHEECFNMLFNEIIDPRFIFKHEELSSLYNDINRLGYIAEDIGIYKIEENRLKELLESNNIIVSIEKIVDFKLDIVAGANEKSYKYIHIPSYIKKLTNSDIKRHDIIDRQFYNLNKYNFN